MVKVDLVWVRSAFSAFVLLALSAGACTVEDESRYTFRSGTDATSGGGSLAGGASTSGGSAPAGAGASSAAGRAGNGGGAAGSGGAGNGSSGSAGDGTSVVVTPGQVAIGMACLMDSDCMSKFCRDGVCCQDACSGACAACASTYTGLVNGVCGPVRTGVDPHDDCEDEGASKPCGRDGQCDGAGACRHYALGRSCIEPGCKDASTFMPAGTCDGNGQCLTATAVDCGQYPCAVTGCAKPCTSNDECPGGYCANGTCRTKKLSGDACSEPGECGTGFCSPDQVCCDTACTGACQACTSKLTGDTSGTCAPVLQGSDPNDDCAAGARESCGNDGSCDGKGKCQVYEAGTSCGAGSCSGATFTPAKVCDGAGKCGSGGAAKDCGSTACTVSGCATSCDKDGDCASGNMCVVATHSCTPRKANGGTCTLGNECLSNACVDGVCCESSCAGKCYACSNAKTGGSAGKCLPVKVGTDVDNDCDLSDESSCGQDGTCDGNGQCRLWSTGTQCVAGSCNSSGNYVSPRTCNAGTCRTATTDTCAPAVCDATLGCKRTCTVKADCIGSTYCDTVSKTCTAQKTPGQACSAGAECLSGFCVDKVCCNTACNGTCVSCLAKDTGLAADGTCGNVKDGTDPANECAAGTTTCGLDGMCGGGKCRVATTTTSCGTVACSGSALTPLSKCDGNGNCPAATAGACPGNVTCASNSACRSTACTADSNCISGYYCASNGACTQKKATGSACSGGSAGNNQCVSNICSSDNICCSATCSLACQGCANANTGAPNGTCSPRITTPGDRDLAACNGACPVGYSLCTTPTGTNPTCNPITWGFEDGSPSDWQDGLAPVNFTQRVPTGGTGLPRTGTWALSSFGTDNVYPWESRLTTLLCGQTGRYMDVHGKTLSFYIYAKTPAPDAGSGGSCKVEYTGIDAAGDGYDGEFATIQFSQYGAWTLYSGTLANNVSKINFVSLSCNFGTWRSGELYFDDISIK